MSHTVQFIQAPTEDRHFIVVGSELLDPQPIDGFALKTDLYVWAAQTGVLSRDGYRVATLPGATGYIAQLLREDDEDSARRQYGDAAVDTYFEEVEGLDVFAARVDLEELARRLGQIGDDVTALAEWIGLPDPGAAKTEDLVREMWAKVHAHDTRHGVHINESRVVGSHA
jgi:hypothetical protein